MFADWLRAHPGVEIICRDRGAIYPKGASTGAPQARQVLDRWHLAKNVSEVLYKACARSISVLRQAARETPRMRPPQPVRAPAGKPRKPPRRRPLTPRPQRAWQLQMFEQVHALAAEVCMGSSSTACSTRMSITLTKLGRIKGSGRRCQSKELSQGHQITKVARSSPSQSWAAYIMSIAVVPEFFQR